MEIFFRYCDEKFICNSYIYQGTLDILINMWSALKIRRGSAGGASGREPARQCKWHRSHQFNPWVRKIPWRREWQPTPACLENPMGRETWCTTVHGATKSQTWLKWLSTHEHIFCRFGLFFFNKNLHILIHC